MSEPCVFVFIRGGRKTIYGDRWAGALLHREMIWGPEALENFAQNFEPILEEELDECDAGVIVDYDQKTVLWSLDLDYSPAVMDAYRKLIASSWPGFEIQSQKELQFNEPRRLEPPLSDHEDGMEGFDEPDEDYEDDWLDMRPESVKEAAGIYDDDEDEDYDDDEALAAEDQEVHVSWITILTNDGNKRHRHLFDLPVTFFKPNRDLVSQLTELDPKEIPSDKLVNEGSVIDIPNQTIYFWGNEDFEKHFDEIDSEWKDWNVKLLQGYSDHCQVAGVEGIYATQAELLAEVMPMMLSTVRMDLNSIMNAMGGGLKKQGIKLAGCLYLVVCVPILLFAVFSGQWTAALVTIGVTFLLFVIGFKWLEYKLKKKFSFAKDFGTHEIDQNTPPAAGPLELDERKAAMNRLLAQAGLPSLDEISQHVDLDETTDFLNPNL